MSELLAHMAGDYVVQSHWMATGKTQAHGPALAHAATYTACFLPLTRDPRALAVIGGTHFVIDRWRLARHLAWAKNQVGPASARPGHTPTGYPEGTPDWLAFGLMIAADNFSHMAINRWALRRWGR